MKDKFEEVYNLMQLNLKYSLWVQQTSIKEHAEELRSEVEEMIAELEKDNYEEFRKELGDVFWDLLKLMAISEKQGLFDIKDLFHEVNEKFKRRKPYLLEHRSVSREEESRIWKEVKEQEKNEQENKTA